MNNNPNPSDRYNLDLAAYADDGCPHLVDDVYDLEDASDPVPLPFWRRIDTTFNLRSAAVLAAFVAPPVLVVTALFVLAGGLS